MTEKAITIRINGGSLEAQFLAEYYPITVLPTFIIINNGQLILDLRPGESKELFKAAVLRALSSRSSQFRSTALSQIPSPDTAVTQQNSDHPVSRPVNLATTSTSAHTSLDQPETSNSGTYLGAAASSPFSPQLATPNSGPDAFPPTAPNMADDADVPSSQSQNIVPAAGVPSNGIHSPATSSASPSGQTSQAVQKLLADRRRRLEVDRREKDAAEKAERKAKAEARKEAMTVAPDSARAKQASYAAQQRKRQQEEKLEREKVLSQIEHDKSERKAKEERRKAIAKAEPENTDGARELIERQLVSEIGSPRSTRSGECAVQIRLFDGSTIRSRFSSDQTLRGNVRPWIDSTKSDDNPYTFKQVLTPMSNRTLSISEEEENLRSLGFSPSVTLVIVPVQGYTAAYSGGQSIISKGVSVGYNVMSAGAGIVGGALGILLGLGQSTTPSEVPDTHDTRTQGIAEADSTGTGTNINIRTLRDQRNDQDDQQLYNGNQVLLHGLFSNHLSCH